jgi:TonB family protein
MFDKMIESNSAGAEFKPRRTYFVVSTLVVGTLFLAAVVVSIYAGNIDLGNADLELSEFLAPVETATPQLEQQPSTPQTRTQMADQLPTRQVNMARVDETLPNAPDSTSVIPNQFRQRPIGDFRLDPSDTDPAGDPGIARNGNTSSNPGLSDPQPRVIDDKPAPEPPPVVKTQPSSNSTPKSIGVVNGIATSLPKPPYPPTAIAMNIQGKVDVQVTIDETGKVISAKAASGHPFLRQAAEKAAWSARFTPTLLSHVPVKVTGVIVYNFTRN